MGKCVWKGVQVVNKNFWCSISSCHKGDIDIYKEAEMEKLLDEKEHKSLFCHKTIQMYKFG